MSEGASIDVEVDDQFDGSVIGPREAAIYETFIVPQYLSHFGALALEMLVPSEDAQVVQLQCRTGYPERELLERLPGAHLYGADSSAAAVELARAKAATLPGAVVEYRVALHPPLDFPASAFSHALALCPTDEFASRAELIAELARLLAPHGQALLAAPVRGSFQELLDLLREYAVKFDDADLGAQLESQALAGPSVESLADALTEGGFDYVDVDVRPVALRFRSGREFVEDPISRLMILPGVLRDLGLEDSAKPLSYVRDAIDKYWSDGGFALSVNIGCASGRRVPG